MRGAAQVALPGFFTFANSQSVSFTFMNVNVSRKSSRGGLQVRNDSKLVLSQLEAFRGWQATRHPPAFVADVFGTLLLCANRAIKLVNGGKEAYVYERKAEESGRDFRDRFVHKADPASEGAVLLSTGKGVKPIPVIWFGEQRCENVQTLFDGQMLDANGSIRVCKRSDDDVDGIRWTNDPYSILTS